MSFLINHKKLIFLSYFFAKKMEGVYTLPVLAIYRWHSRRKRVLKKNSSINKVLREEKEDIEAQKYDAGMILWYSKI